MLSDEMLPVEIAPLSKTAAYADILRFAKLSDDFNPIHVDRDFAAKSPMGALVAHGPMSFGLLLQAISNCLGLPAVERLTVNVRFIKPVRENDVVTVGGRLVEGHADRYHVWARNHLGEAVIEGTATLRPPFRECTT
jgi:3-hydroxybutyryl-CoA dehydratase